MLLLRRIYRAPELFQLLATFGVVLIVQDADAGDLGAGGPARAARAAGCAASSRSPGSRFPKYELLLIGIGPLVLRLLLAAVPPHALGHAGARRDAGPRDGRALGVDQRWLFTCVCSLGVGAGRDWAARCRCRARR